MENSFFKGMADALALASYGVLSAPARIIPGGWGTKAASIVIAAPFTAPVWLPLMTLAVVADGAAMELERR